MIETHLKLKTKMTDSQEQTLTKSQKEYLQNVIIAWKEAGKEMRNEDYQKIISLIIK